MLKVIDEIIGCFDIEEFFISSQGSNPPCLGPLPKPQKQKKKGRKIFSGCDCVI
jgi:hypothetical protein